MASNVICLKLLIDHCLDQSIMDGSLKNISCCIPVFTNRLENRIIEATNEGICG